MFTPLFEDAQPIKDRVRALREAERMRFEESLAQALAEMRTVEDVLERSQLREA